MFLLSPLSIASAPYGEVTTPEVIVVEQPDIKEYTQQMATKYGVDFYLLDKVINCESGWNAKAINKELHPDGTVGSVGIAQFKPSTFYSFAEEAGMEATSPEDPYQSTELLAWGISTGKGSHWTCWRKVTGYN